MTEFFLLAGENIARARNHTFEYLSKSKQWIAHAVVCDAVHGMRGNGADRITASHARAWIKKHTDFDPDALL